MNQVDNLYGEEPYVPVPMFPDVDAFPIEKSNVSNTSFRLCGFPGFCSKSDFEHCSSAALKSCHACGAARSAVFLFVVILLALAIISGNILIILVEMKKNEKDKSNKVDICKTSLALADFLTGIQILIVPLYNFSWSNALTTEELTKQVLEIRGSLEAYVGGILYMFTITSSLYHLLYMSILLCIAMKRPFLFRNLSIKRVTWQLGIVWVVSLLAASSPGWVPSQFTFSYHVSILLFQPTIQYITTNADYSSSIAFLVIMCILPYLMLIALLIGNGILIKQGETKRNKVLYKRNRKNKIWPYKTIAVMTLGFTITYVPLSVVACLVYIGYLDCSSASTPRLICTYVGMLSSFINSGIYSFRDADFLRTVKDMFLPLRCIKLPNLRRNKSFKTGVMYSFEGVDGIHLSENSQKETITTI